MSDSTAHENELVQFLRKRDYILVRELGQGACGKTVLLHDDQIDEYFVCKKYSPSIEAMRHELFEAFKREIKLLHRVHHENVVRVFNYFLYPDQKTGYILMEFIDGIDIGSYLHGRPEEANEVFIQSINGFSYLEQNDILHRDIRPSNLMIREDGAVKIIDFGFGKQIHSSHDFEKSITLNWWCELPFEFGQQEYSFKTDVYFVGKLFEKIIRDNDLRHFKYEALVRQMCERDANARIQSFNQVHSAIKSDQFRGIEFSEDELLAYRSFSDALKRQITKIEDNVEYFDDVARIKLQLNLVYRNCMLEWDVPDAAALIRCFLNGTYYYKRQGMQVAVVKDFLRLLQSASDEQCRIILANLHRKLDTVPRYSTSVNNDDIPF